MDIFSLGCVIAELFLEGQPIFTSPQLLSYRKGEYDPTPFIERIQDKGVQRLVKAMIQLDPNLRDSADYYLKTWCVASPRNRPFLDYQCSHDGCRAWPGPRRRSQSTSHFCRMS
jgi:phosphoinositide-3-kinase regulatory subunit 4